MVSYRMVRLVAGNSDAITLTDLQADTQYQLVITAVRAGKKYRSRPIVFRTLGKLRHILSFFLCVANPICHFLI